jgi:hypothetical protein
VDHSCPESTWPARGLAACGTKPPWWCDSSRSRGKSHRCPRGRWATAAKGGERMAANRPPPLRAQNDPSLDSQDSPPAARRDMFRERIPGHLRGVTIHPCRSKEPVVRLEPFFPTAPVAPREAAMRPSSIGGSGAAKFASRAAERSAAHQGAPRGTLEGRAGPRHLAGRSLQASCLPLSRRKPRFTILVPLGFLRRSIGMGQPSCLPEIPSGSAARSRGPYAARLMPRDPAPWAADSNLTATRLEMPDSSWVTP